MLPTTNSEDIVEFVADNSITEQFENAQVNDGYGNIEAETNRLTEEQEDEAAEAAVEQMENNEDAASGGAFEAAHEQTASHLLASDELTIENNEETEVNDNFNESSEADKAHFNEYDAVEQLENSNDDGDAEVAAATDIATHFNYGNNNENENDSDIDNINENEHEKEKDTEDNNDSNVNGSKQREDDVSSSDDEGAVEPFEMNPTFNSEWESLADDLAQINDEHNNLSNDIDVYESIPVDLSNDIAVNDVAAANPDFPLNPDAEFIDVVDTGAAGAASHSKAASASDSSMPKFEKLTLSSAINPTSYQPTTFAHQMK